MAHLLDVRIESNFQFISITAQHVAGCSFLLEHAGSDADLAVPVIQSFGLHGTVTAPILGLLDTFGHHLSHNGNLVSR